MINTSIKKHHLFWLTLLVICVLAFIIRWQQVRSNLYFGFEQGRDAYRAMEIWTGKDLALVGPKTDIDGIFHGPLYYYLLAIVYGVGRQNPWVVVIAHVLVNSLVPLLLAAILYGVTRHKGLACLGALLGATSLEFVSYGAWISNVPISLPLSLAAVYCFVQYLKNGSNRSWLLGVGLALLAAQFEIILLMEWGWVIALITLAKKSIRPATLAISAILGFMSISWLILFNLIHRWMIVGALKLYLSEGHGSIAQGISGLWWVTKIIVQRTQYLPHLLLVPAIILCGFGIFKLLSGTLRSVTLFILGFIFMSVPTLFFAGSVKLDQIHVNLGVGLVLLLCLIAYQYTSMYPGKISRLVILGVVVLLVLGNLYASTHHQGLFFVSSHGLTVAAQQSVFQYITSESNHQPVTLKSYTRPYLHEEGWQFMADYYRLPRDPNAKDIYVTIEPWVDEFWVNKWNEELGLTRLVDTHKFGEITLEHRIRE